MTPPNEVHAPAGEARQPPDLPFRSSRSRQGRVGAALEPEPADQDARDRLAAAARRLRRLRDSGVAPRPRDSAGAAAAAPDPDGDEPPVAAVPLRPSAAVGWSAASLAALALSALWLGAAAARFAQLDARTWLASANPDLLALAAIGVAAPLLVVWIAAGHLRLANAQRAEAKSLRVATDHLAAQSRAADLTARHLRLETYLRLSVFHLDAMAREAAVLARGLFGFDASEEDRLWGRYAQGDRDLFFRLFTRYGPDVGDALARLIARDDEAARSAHALSGHFAVFLTLADDVDRGNLVTEGHRRGHLGALAGILNVALYGAVDPFATPRPDSDA